MAGKFWRDLVDGTRDRTNPIGQKVWNDRIHGGGLTGLQNRILSINDHPASSTISTFANKDRITASHAIIRIRACRDGRVNS